MIDVVYINLKIPPTIPTDVSLHIFIMKIVLIIQIESTLYLTNYPNIAETFKGHKCVKLGLLYNSLSVLKHQATCQLCLFIQIIAGYRKW